MRNMVVPHRTPAAQATLAPTYSVLDIGKHGQPKLTVAEVARVRNVLREVKPCQRSLLRFAFSNDDRSAGTLALFFPIIQEGNGYSGAHIFGTSNAIYMWDGKIVATMFTTTDKAAIEMQGCAHKYYGLRNRGAARQRRSPT